MTSIDRQIIPTEPGVYFFKNAKGKVLYVGKAANLRNRVASYFLRTADLSPLKQRMVAEAATITWEKTGSEIEALLQEAHYIKKYLPANNVLLRDDKTYVSVEITKETFPRILPTRSPEKGATVYGPFTDASAVKETLKVLRRLFPYRTSCAIPRSAKNNAGSHSAKAIRDKQAQTGRACLDFHLGLCPGVCNGTITQTEYKKTIRHLKDFFDGRRTRLIASLKIEAKKLKTVKSLQKAARLESQAISLEKVLAMTHVLSFSEKAEGDTTELMRILNLTKLRRIEGYDISHISGTLTTASMVVFTDGQADKNEYRKFKIKTVHGANDFASMVEVLRRRFDEKHLTNDKRPTTNNVGGPLAVVSRKPTWPRPDLVIIDGGRPQLSAATKVWKKLKLSIPLIALAKRQEEIFVPGQPNPIMLPRNSGALHLLQRVRDEAHRFAVSYHTLLRRKKLIHK